MREHWQFQVRLAGRSLLLNCHPASLFAQHPCCRSGVRGPERSAIACGSMPTGDHVAHEVRETNGSSERLTGSVKKALTESIAVESLATCFRAFVVVEFANV